MDPLLSRLSKDFVNDSDLRVKICSLFQVAVNMKYIVPLMTTALTSSLQTTLYLSAYVAYRVLLQSHKSLQFAYILRMLTR